MDEISQREKQQVMGDSYHARTNVDEELGGRFQRKPPTVVGKSPTPYPKLPPNLT